MSPCNASDLSMDVTASPPPTIPGIGSLFAPIQIPIPELDLPTDLIQDLLALMEELGALFPSGLFKANPDFGMKNILDFIANILSQLAPFLSFYNFIMAALNLIICIIEVICAIPNMFAVAVKLKKLFAECLPPFLNLFPWMALLAMILALLLLILALILYIVEMITAIILSIIRNILIFTDALQLSDSESVIAAVNKLASLLCFIENLMAIFLAIAAILAIIKALAAFAGLAVCDDNDDEGCCAPESCPEFIRNNFEIISTTGEFVYHHRVNLDTSGIPGIPAALAEALSASVAPLRLERWQLFDTDAASEEPINSIITPLFYGSQIFYPDQEFDADTPPARAPYTVDMRMLIDPGIFHPTDADSAPSGARYMRINDCVVVRRPYVGEITYNAQSVFGTYIPTDNDSTGTFNLEGGLVFEDDGETPFEVEGMAGSLAVMTQATLNDFICADAETRDALPLFEDGYRISNVEFTWKPNHPALAGHNIISVGCFPGVSLEKAVRNNIIFAEGATASILSRLPAIGDLGDDVTDTVQCVQGAVAKFRTAVNVDNANILQAEVETCLNNLSGKVTDIYCDALIEGVSQFNTTFSIDTDIQFTTRNIAVTVVLLDGGGTVISNNIPSDCLTGDDNISDRLTATATLGEVSDFSYDRGNGTFVAQLTSAASGPGDLQVLFDGNVISELIQGTDFDTPSSIKETVLTYTFVDAAAEKAVDRDVTDVAKDGS